VFFCRSHISNDSSNADDVGNHSMWNRSRGSTRRDGSSWEPSDSLNLELLNIFPGIDPSCLRRSFRVDPLAGGVLHVASERDGCVSEADASALSTPDNFHRAKHSKPPTESQRPVPVGMCRRALSAVLLPESFHHATPLPLFLLLQGRPTGVCRRLAVHSICPSTGRKTALGRRLNSGKDGGGGRSALLPNLLDSNNDPESNSG
jgi:hypothetical protein